MNLLLLDFTSETNLGDLALQAGLQRLVHESYPHARVAATVVYGANQDWASGPHFADLLSHEEVAVAGSLRPTFYPEGPERTDPLWMEVKNLGGLAGGLGILLLLAIDRRTAERLLPRRFAATCRLIRDADYVLWKGKNFRGTHWLIEPYRVLSRLVTPSACLLYGKPLFNVASSLWPLNNPLSRILLRAVLRRCRHVTVRETASQAEVGRLLGGCAKRPPVTHAPDLAFAILRDRLRSRGSRPRRAGNGLRIALTVMDWAAFSAEERERYVDAIVRFIEHTAGEGTEYRIVPQAVTPWEAADGVIARILDRLPAVLRASVSVVRNDAGIAGVLDEYSQADYLLGTRMHSAIFALSVGTPAVAIACDKGAKWQILADLGYGEFVIPYDQLSGACLIGCFEELRSREATVMEGVFDSLTEHARRVGDHVRVLDPYLSAPPAGVPEIELHPVGVSHG